MIFKVSLRLFTLTGLRNRKPGKLLPFRTMASYNSRHPQSTSKQNVLSDIRKEKRIPLDSNYTKPGPEVKIMSYNILSQVLLEKHTELYIGNNRKYLEWEYRKQLLYKELRDSNVDFLCLQEVEEEILADLAMYLSTYGYKYVYKKRTSFNVDGCALFYLEKKFNLHSYSCLEFFKPDVQQLDRHNIAIVATFSLANSDRQVVVATTHILFNQKRQDIKLMQIQMLFTEVDRQAFISEDNYRPILITGDFNFNETSPVYSFITEGHIDLNYVNKRSLLPMDRQDTRYHLRSTDLLPPVLGITDQCSYVKEFGKRNNLNTLYLRNEELVEETTNQTIANMFLSKQLSHNLKLSNVFETEVGQVASTYHDEWRYVDFIFYNKKNKCPVKNEYKLQLVSYVTLPTPLKSLN
uniref:Protein angel homolog 2 n=2 Tax=Cacopsylla melanoneura TaxID=428564 RepID=A0A8D9BSX8_9HEMI